MEVKRLLECSSMKLWYMMCVLGTLLSNCVLSDFHSIVSLDIMYSWESDLATLIMFRVSSVIQIWKISSDKDEGL